MSNIINLPNVASQIGWQPGGSCVFYNFAWGGISTLSDLDIEAQMHNIHWASNALIASKKLNCDKFIHVGTMEEAFTNKYLNLDYHKNNEYNRHVVYSVAKMASRNALKILAQQLSIKLIIATNSHVMGPNDDKDSFLQVTLGKLISGEELIFSTGEQIFDVISVNDCALAYELIGENGKPFSEYWVGSGQPRRLREYVEIMANLYPSGEKLQFGKFPYNDIALSKQDFSIDRLKNDTGFKPMQSYEDTVCELFIWLTKKEMTY